MTLSTMAAAALGNTISDVLGIGSAVYVERLVELIGVKPPDLTPVQLEMKSARRASNFVSFDCGYSHVSLVIYLYLSPQTGSCNGNYRRLYLRNDSIAIF